MKFFNNLYMYRELLKTSVQKDVRGKYKNSILGVVWSFLNPLLQIAVYAFVFGKILNVGTENYAVFICCGLIPWTFFCNAINRSAYTIIENGGIIKKVFFPREVLPISVVTAECVNFFISTIIIVAFVLLTGLGVSWTWVFYPVVLFVLYFFLIAISLLVSSITAYVRDIQHFIGVLLQLMFYATPIAYESSRVPETFQWIVRLNPVAYVIEAFRSIFINHAIPNVSGLGIMFLISIVLFMINYAVFEKLQKNFAEQF